MNEPKNTAQLFRSLQFKMIFLSTFGLVVLLMTVFLYVFPKYEHQFIENQKASVKATIDIAHNVLVHYGQMVEQNKMSEAEAQEHAKAVIRKMRYNQTDYFFIYAFDGLTMVHPVNPNYEGTDRSGAKDSQGHLNIKGMMNIATSPAGEGFSEYYANKVKDGPSFGKISYAKAYGPWKWFIGTGVYKDVVENEISDFKISILLGFAVVTLLVVLANWIYSLRFTRNIYSIIGSVRELASQVTSSISQLSGTGKSLSTASTNVAASLEETVASLEEVESIIKLNSENAATAASLSMNSKSSAENGEKEILRLIHSMSEISASSKKIDQIISVIDDIAFQTNLLALNAAVEAARAGDQGKGFAVVADAVRTLAQRSASAAKDISALIKDSVEKIETGVDLADKSNDVLKTILSSVNQVADLNREIASASAEQLRGIEQINEAMNQLDKGSQSNAASAEEISSNVIEIANHTQKVDQQVVILNKLVAG